MLGLVQGKDGVVRGMVLLHKRHSITNLFRKCALGDSKGKSNQPPESRGEGMKPGPEKKSAGFHS